MFAAMFLALAVDLSSKAGAHAYLLPQIRQEFIPHLLNLILVSNTGLAFSMVNDNGVLAKFIAAFVFILLLYFYCRRYIFAIVSDKSESDQRNTMFLTARMPPVLEQLGVSIIIGAAAGNLFERFIYGHVTDFLEFAFITFPVFNLADILIDVGVGLVLISIWQRNKNQA
jgi:signal peptidase II